MRKTLEREIGEVCACLFCVLVSVGVRKGRLQGKIKGYIAVMLFKHR